MKADVRPPAPPDTPTSSAPEIPLGDQRLVDRLNHGYSLVLSRCAVYGLRALSISLGLVYIWFGALKLTDYTPVADLVRNSIPFIQAPYWIVPALGIIEILIGLALLVRLAPRLVLPLFLAHMVGTFSVLVVQPEVAFLHHNPLLLSMTGEFVVKNLVLLVAGVAVCATAKAKR